MGSTGCDDAAAAHLFRLSGRCSADQPAGGGCSVPAAGCVPEALTTTQPVAAQTARTALADGQLAGDRRAARPDEACGARHAGWPRHAQRRPLTRKFNFRSGDRTSSQ